MESRIDELHQDYPSIFNNNFSDDMTDFIETIYNMGFDDGYSLGYDEGYRDNE